MDVSLCTEAAKHQELAENHYRCLLLHHVFRALRKNVLEASCKQMRRNLAFRQHQVTLMQRFWNCWKSSLERKEEVQHLCLTLAAHSHYRETWTRRLFERWRLRTHQQQEYQMSEKMAVRHAEQQLLAQFWYVWRQRTVDHIEEQEEETVAQEHYCHQVLQAAFHLWKENVQEIKQGRTKEGKARSFHSLKLLKWSWSKWQQYLRHRSEKWEKLVKADVHYQHVLLHRTLSAWKIYQIKVQHILYQVAKKEKQQNQELLRQVLHSWRQKVAYLKGKAKKAILAKQLYRRTVLSKVIFHWRDATSLRSYCRQQKAAAVMDARRNLLAVKLQSAFQLWKEAYISSSRQRGLLFVAAQHHRRQLLNKCMTGWKQYHLWCIRNMLLQRQGDILMTRRLLSTCFSLWKIQLAYRRWEQQETVRALWHWSLSLQGKVFDAWVGYILEQQRKKGRIEKAIEVYRSDLLQEGVTCILRYTAGMKQFRGKLQTQHQLKTACRHYELVFRCAMLWKQKALCRKQGLSLSGAPLKKRVTFKMPVPDATSMANRDIWEASSLCSVLKPAHSVDLPLCLAARDSILTDLHTAWQGRLQPRRPDFLLQSPERMEMPGPSWNGLQTPSVPFQQTALNKPCPSAGASLPSNPKQQSAGSALSQLGISSCPSPPLLKSAVLPCHWSPSTTCSKLELLPPSSFVPPLKNREKMNKKQSLSFQPGCDTMSHQVAVPQERLATSQRKDLLLPDDIVSSKSPSPLYKGAGKQENQMDSPLQQTTGVHTQLEAELQHIGQKMQRYHSNQQELKSCQRWQRILLMWLQMNIGTKEQEDVQQVQEELDQMKVQIKSLTSILEKERQEMRTYSTRIQDIQAALNS